MSILFENLSLSGGEISDVEDSYLNETLSSTESEENLMKFRSTKKFSKPSEY